MHNVHNDELRLFVNTCTCSFISVSKYCWLSINHFLY
uniref:Uncharacterized protein n=1 Tax=Amphimedon queenslandica TaxID=400682 RepID=A0A1X7TRV6_AMPQE